MAKADEIKNEARRYRRKQELNSAKNQFIAARTTYHRFDPFVEKVHKINSLIGLDVTYIFRTFTRIEHDGLRLNLLNMHFHHVGVGLSAIRAWLQSMGCKEITYEFVASEVLVQRYHSK